MTHYPSSSFLRRTLVACSFAFALCAGCLAPAVASAVTRKAPFSYAFTATQQTQWSYDNRVVPDEDCSVPPSRGSGKQKLSFSAAGKAVFETDLSRNVKTGGFGEESMATRAGQATYDRQGAFVIENSKRGTCAQPDLIAPVQGCGAGRTPFRFGMNLTDGEFRVFGTALQEPYDDGPIATCPFMYYANFDQIEVFNTNRDDGNSEDLDNGLLATTMNVSSSRFFKGRKVVLRGSRTARYMPTSTPGTRSGDPTGLVAETTVAWTLTFKPKKKQ